MPADANRMRELAKLGGAATKAKGAEYYREIGAMGGRANKGKPKAKRQKKSAVVVDSVSDVRTIAQPAGASAKPMLDSLDAIIADIEAPRK